MMDCHCFNKEELSAFLEKQFGLPICFTVSNLDVIIDQWESWQLELSCLATLLSQTLEAKQKQHIDVEKILKELSVFSEVKGLFTIETISERFLDFMFSFVRNTDLGIEDNLVEIKRQLNERGY